MIASRDDKVILKPSPLKWGYCLVFFILLAVGGVLFVREQGVISAVMGSVSILFGATGTVACLVALFTSRLVLKLTQEGFAFGTLLRSYTYSWSDVDVFGVSEFVGRKHVCFNFCTEHRGEEKPRAVNQAYIGFDRFLPDNYGMAPMELATLLEDWRRRHSENHFSGN